MVIGRELNEVVRLFRETHPDLPPLNQGTISKIEAQYREMGHVRKVPSKRQAVVDDDTKLNLLLALEENPPQPVNWPQENLPKPEPSDCPTPSLAMRMESRTRKRARAMERLKLLRGISHIDSRLESAGRPGPRRLCFANKRTMAIVQSTSESPLLSKDVPHN
ncbi:hypothetical protein NQ318_002567 [Aromia moschata]|uniref:DUF4817 domain-containing protein n=1 Tax=Aromia moschata TaxID=1265417 RepID=A0AAV8Y5I7_9CUCU|nr:hypothetical protein NQ318_002567 [Aromia moschata]